MLRDCDREQMRCALTAAPLCHRWMANVRSQTAYEGAAKRSGERGESSLLLTEYMRPSRLRGFDSVADIQGRGAGGGGGLDGLKLPD